MNLNASVGSINPNNQPTIASFSKSEAEKDQLKRMKKCCSEFNNKVIKSFKVKS